MDRFRRFRSAVLVVVLAVASGALAGALQPVHAVPVGGICGIARDAAGQALPDVEILVLRDGSAEALFSGITDAKGWFQLPAVVPGLYRVVAVKPGYLATLLHVNTFLRSSLDLVLRPVPDAVAGPTTKVPSDKAWALRVPKRSVLREIEADTLLADRRSVDVTPASRNTALIPAVDGGFEQLVSVVGSGAGTSSSRQAIQGTETRMRLATSLGERGVIELRGRRETLGAPVGPADGGAQLNRQASSLWLDVKMDTDPDAKLAMKAFYTMREFRTDGSDAAAGPFGGGESQRAWGYDATWTKQVDASSQVALRVGYADAQLDVPSVFVPERAVASAFAESRVGLENRSMDAVGSYEALVASGHQLRVGARMRMLDLGAPSIRAGSEDMPFGLQGTAGWNLAMDAQDSWSVGPSVSVIYGMGLGQTLGNGTYASSLVAPRAGASFAAPWITVRGLVTYYRTFGGAMDRSPEGIPPAFLPATRVGWEAEAETPLPGGVRIRAEYAYAPLQFEPRHLVGPAWMPDRLVFATDGNASDAHTTLTLERQSPRAAGVLQWTEGSAVGVLSQVALGDLPVTILADRVLDYRIGRLGTRIVPSGTEIALEYQQIVEAARVAGTESVPESAQQYVEVQVSQHLARFRRPGTYCRFVMAARAPLQPSDVAIRAGESERTRLLAALNRRVSAGLALEF